MDTDPASTLILVVDDSETSCNLLRAHLRFGGFNNVLVALSGQEALDVLADRIPDLILLDVMMPDMDGFEVTRRIHRLYPDHFIPIILVSALQQPQDRVLGIRAGANDFLSRPFDESELIARIRSLLALKQMRDGLEAERRRLALLYKASSSFSSRLDFQELMHEIVALAAAVTGAAKSLLVALDDQGRFQQKILARAGKQPRSSSSVDQRVLRDGLLGWVIQHGETAIIGDVRQDPRWAALPGDDQAISALAVPLLRAHQVTGVLLVTAPQPEAFDAGHLGLLQSIGSHAAIALENARLFEEARRQRARLEALFSQTGDPVVVTDSGGSITAVNPAARRVLGLDDTALSRPAAVLLGLSVADLLHRARERCTAVSGSYTQRTHDEAPRAFNISVSPIEGVGYMLVWQDVTALKEAEQVRLNSERAERQRVLEVFSRYMSPKLVERVLGDRDILSRRERREAYVLFTDLRGFTRLTVEHSADDVLALLNDVFAEMVEIAYAHEGVIFDIAGDELMIAFNVPYDQADAGRRVLDTALAMQRRFAELKAKWAVQGMHVGMGIGINHGSVVLGHVGGRGRMNYAMVGETVNIAHRLVEIARDGQIVLARSVLDGQFEPLPGLVVRDLFQPIRGRDTPLPVTIIELDHTLSSPM